MAARRRQRPHQRKFYKVEKWSKHDQRVEQTLWTGNSLDKAREIFNAEVRRRPLLAVFCS